MIELNNLIFLYFTLIIFSSFFFVYLSKSRWLITWLKVVRCTIAAIYWSIWLVDRSGYDWLSVSARSSFTKVSIDRIGDHWYNRVRGKFHLLICRIARHIIFVKLWSSNSVEFECIFGRCMFIWSGRLMILLHYGVIGSIKGAGSIHLMLNIHRLFSCLCKLWLHHLSAAKCGVDVKLLRQALLINNRLSLLEWGYLAGAIQCLGFDGWCEHCRGFLVNQWACWLLESLDLILWFCIFILCNLCITLWNIFTSVAH